MNTRSSVGILGIHAAEDVKNCVNLTSNNESFKPPLNIFGVSA